MTKRQILTVDLGNSGFDYQELQKDTWPALIGGRGLNAWLLYNNLSPDTKPLQPGNRLIMSAGLLAASGAPASSRLHISALSPATGLMGGSNAGGHFAQDLAHMGITAIQFTGRATSPSCLYIIDGEPELRLANDWWSMDSWQVIQAIEDQNRDMHMQCAVIGPAGENQAAMAAVLVGRHSTAGRTGMGAVMGSKNLKAVVLLSSSKPKIKTSPQAKALVADYVKKLRKAPNFNKTSQAGQSGYIPWANDMGLLASRNFKEVQFKKAGAFDHEIMMTHKKSSRSCARCPIGCKADLKVDTGRRSGLTGPRPEFESLAALGPRCGLDNLEDVYHLSNRCAQLGMDTISAGACIAFAMELNEKGLLTPEQAGGLDLSWGNMQAIERLLEQIAMRKGLGAILADGVDQACDKLPPGARDYAFTVKGLELSCYDPRAVKGAALGYAVADRGADWGYSFSTPEYRWTPERAQAELGTPLAADRFSESGKADLIRRSLIVCAVLDTLGVCKVPSLGLLNDFSLQNESEMVKVFAGMEISADTLVFIGERIVNLERLFNLRFAGGRSLDNLPQRFLEEPAPSGPAKGQVVDLESMLLEFYQVMGWSSQGEPEAAKLQELRIG
jgi:aldehyde:ferredoxin oxidoreductase